MVSSILAYSENPQEILYMQSIHIWYESLVVLLKITRALSGLQIEMNSQNFYLLMDFLWINIIQNKRIRLTKFALIIDANVCECRLF